MALKKSLRYVTTGSWWKSLLLALPMLLVMLVMLTGGRPDLSNHIYCAALLTTIVFFATLFYLMLYTGHTDRYRAIGFVVAAVMFALSFITNLVSARGSMTFSNNEMLRCEIPFCHMVTTMIIIPAALKQTIIFPGQMTEGFASIGMMLVLVIGFSIVLGRGFCSWGCFYGGWDDGFSRLRRKSLVGRINDAFKWFSFAMLVYVALSAAATLSPTYCDWLCPYKTITEYEAITSTTVLIKTIVFLLLFITLVVVLPIVTRKRIQCATFCPMGALLSLANKINIFRIRTDHSKCIGCNKCNAECPMLAMSREHEACINCSKCGRCIDACPTGALRYAIAGTRGRQHDTLARTLFLYPAFGMMVVFLGSQLLKGLMLIFKLCLTGSLI